VIIDAREAQHEAQVARMKLDEQTTDSYSVGDRVTVQKSPSGQEIFSGTIREIRDGKKGGAKVFTIGTGVNGQNEIKVTADSAVTIKKTSPLKRSETYQGAQDRTRELMGSNVKIRSTQNGQTYIGEVIGRTPENHPKFAILKINESEAVIFGLLMKEKEEKDAKEKGKNTVREGDKVVLSVSENGAVSIAPYSKEHEQEASDRERKRQPQQIDSRGR
jgi:hypothetical protein